MSAKAFARLARYRSPVPAGAPAPRRAAGLRLAVLIGLVALLGACGSPIRTEYAAYANRLQADNHLRTDRAPRDAPYSDRDLQRNFLAIAFALEQTSFQEARKKRLSRWQVPIRYLVVGGDRQDVARVDAMMRRLAKITGHPIRRVKKDSNLLVLFADQQERQQVARYLDHLSGPGAVALAQVVRISEYESPCRGGLGYGSDRSSIASALVIINDETSGLLRQACIEEELSQAMGLTNDDPDVRPSIFNDDQEFALLTDHDAILLRMLYHPLLKPGMTEDQARRRLGRVLADLRRRGLR
ncbi:MAG: DUF2927 domain-containing protein [Alphaproteobacteria bacterium]|nr:MAG: DUF2927 domain-containing protein [Alphaproteobacteria bacterium]